MSPLWFISLRTSIYTIQVVIHSMVYDTTLHLFKKSMKRKAVVNAVPDAKRNAIKCNICFEPCVPRQDTTCRRCGKVFCADCWIKWMERRKRISCETNKPPTLPCPCCNLVPFYKPDCLLPGSGAEWSDFNELLMYCGTRPFAFRPTKKDNKVAGVVIIEMESDDYWERTFSYDHSDVELLEKYAADKDYLLKSLEQSGGAVICLRSGENKDLGFLKSQFEKMGVQYEISSLQTSNKNAVLITSGLKNFIDQGGVFF